MSATARPSSSAPAIAADRRYLAQLADSWRSRSRSSRLSGQRPPRRRPGPQRHRGVPRPAARRNLAPPPALRPVCRRLRHLPPPLCPKPSPPSPPSTANGTGSCPPRSGPPRTARPPHAMARKPDRPRAAAHPLARTRPRAALQSAIPPALTSAADHPGERQLQRLERQAEVLHRQLRLSPPARLAPRHITSRLPATARCLTRQRPSSRQFSLPASPFPVSNRKIPHSTVLLRQMTGKIVSTVGRVALTGCLRCFLASPHGTISRPAPSESAETPG